MALVIRFTNNVTNNAAVLLCVSVGAPAVILKEFLVAAQGIVNMISLHGSEALQ